MSTLLQILYFCMAVNLIFAAFVIFMYFRIISDGYVLKNKTLKRPILFEVYLFLRIEEK